jgi:hypothetical protein
LTARGLGEPSFDFHQDSIDVRAAHRLRGDQITRLVPQCARRALP